MKKAILLAAFIAGCGPAIAADLPVKAPIYASVANPCSNLGCSGFYLGAEISEPVTGFNILNLGGSINTGGMSLGTNGGYQFFNGTYWLGIGAKVEYAVVSPPTAVVGGGFTNKLFGFEGIEFGGVISNMFSIASINLPAWLATAVPTIKIGACQNGNSLRGYCSGAAAHFFIPASRWTIDAEYLNAQYGNTTTAPGVTATTENRGSLGFSYHF